MMRESTRANERAMVGESAIVDERHKREMRRKPVGYRRKCRCSCGRWATHVGTANGVTVMHGCEQSVRRWIRDSGK